MRGATVSRESLPFDGDHYHSTGVSTAQLGSPPLNGSRHHSTGVATVQPESFLFETAIVVRIPESEPICYRT